MSKADVASVLPTSAVPHPPWFRESGTGLVWVRDANDAKAFRVTSTDVLRIPRSSGFWSRTILGPVPAGGIESGNFPELDAL